MTCNFNNECTHPAKTELVMETHVGRARWLVCEHHEKILLEALEHAGEDFTFPWRIYSVDQHYAGTPKP